jgi:hypothetical protein
MHSNGTGTVRGGSLTEIERYKLEIAIQGEEKLLTEKLWDPS